jgi:hypothetical protein
MSDTSAFQRAPRPLIGWGGVLLIAVCLFFLIGIAAIALYALWRWANGLPVDLMGFAALVGAAAPAGGVIWRMVVRYMDARHIERMDQQERGTAPNSPFSPAAGSSEPAVNPHGGPNAP